MSRADSRSLDQTRPPTPIHPDTQRFKELCGFLIETHERKSHDYGSQGEPLANFEQSRHFGVQPFVGIMIRLNDKIIRIQNFIDKGNLKNESVYDSLLDIAAYALLAHIQLTKESDHLGPVENRSRR